MSDQVADTFPLVAAPARADRIILLKYMGGGVYLAKNSTVETLQIGSAKAYGALGDGKAAQGNASMSSTSSSTILTSPVTPFTSDDVNKLVVVEGAGASSATLIASIVSRNSANTATLSTPALTTVSNVRAVWASDDTAAIQAAIDNEYAVIIPSGSIYGITALRLRQGSQLLMGGLDTAILSRMSAGVGGAMLGMASGEPAQKVMVINGTLWANQIGTNNDGLALGIETPGTTSFANGSYVHNVRVQSASGIGIYVDSNAGYMGQVWVQNIPGEGTPIALSRPNAMAFKSTTSTLYADLISTEGYFENGAISLGAGGSHIGRIQMQLSGVYSGKDAIQFANSMQFIDSIYSYSGGTNRDFIRVLSGVQGIHVKDVVNDANNPLTVTYLINDLQTGKTIPATIKHVIDYGGSTGNTANFNDGIKLSIGGRFATSRGANVASANDLTLGIDGNLFQISGTTTINAITTANWPGGSVITLLFLSTAVLKHNTSGSAGTAKCFLAGSADFSGAANRTITLQFDDTQWQEISRKVP